MSPAPVPVTAYVGPPQISAVIDPKLDLTADQLLGCAWSGEHRLLVCVDFESMILRELDRQNDAKQGAVPPMPDFPLLDL